MVTGPENCSPRLAAVMVGNTTISFGLFDLENGDPSKRPLTAKGLDSKSPDFRVLLGALPPNPCNWVVGSVYEKAERELYNWVTQQRPTDGYIKLVHDDFPLKMDVSQPHRVGIDRIAAAVSANRLRIPGHAAIVVDSGTALTVDMISVHGIFLGGAILPGHQLALDALFYGTDLLPRVAFPLDEPAPTVIGRDTIEAIRSGIYWGQVGAIRELIENMSAEVAEPVDVFVTGGGIAAMTRPLSIKLTEVPHLVLSGIAVAAQS